MFKCFTMVNVLTGKINLLLYLRFAAEYVEFSPSLGTLLISPNCTELSSKILIHNNLWVFIHVLHALYIYTYLSRLSVWTHNGGACCLSSLALCIDLCMIFRMCTKIASLCLLDSQLMPAYRAETSERSACL